MPEIRSTRTRDSSTVEPSAGVAHGRDVNATNTGIVGAGVSEASLTTTAGAVTYSTPGQVIEGKKFTGDVTISAANVTLRKCLFTSPAASAGINLRITGSGALVEDVTMRQVSGSSYQCIIPGPGTTLRRVNASGGENIVTAGAAGITIDSCYLWGTTIASNPSGHADTIEVYGATNMTITKSRIMQTYGLGDAPINCTSYGGDNCDGIAITDCYIAGGNSHILVDVQAGSSYVRNVQVLRCDFDGHTDNGRYSALQDNESYGTVATSALQTATPTKILWPSSGADASKWVDCADLVPDRTGQLVTA